MLARNVLDLLPDAYTYANHQGLAMLKDWDAVLAPDSAAAALYAGDTAAVTALLAYLMFDEQLNLVQIAGMGITALGVALVNRK